MTKKYIAEIKKLTRNQLEKAMVREAELRQKTERALPYQGRTERRQVISHG
jgi:hypothetical protein